MRISDWLLKMLIKWSPESLKRITFRGMLVSVLVALIVILLVQAAVPLEMAFFAAGDFLTYMEILTVVGLMASRVHFQGIRAATIRCMKGASQLLANLLRRGEYRLRQLGGICRTNRRSTIERKSSNDDPDPFVWGVPA